MNTNVRLSSISILFTKPYMFSLYCKRADHLQSVCPDLAASNAAAAAAATAHDSNRDGPAQN